MRPGWAPALCGLPLRGVIALATYSGVVCVYPAIDVLSVRHRAFLVCATMVGLEPTTYERATAFVPSGRSVTELPATGSGSRTHILLGQG